MNLQHIHVFGLGINTDFLLQLSDRAQSAKLPEASPESYDLPPKTPLEEAILEAWDDARKLWAKHQDRQTETWAGWLRPLLKILDYNFGGQSSSAGKYTVRHLSETGDVPLHLCHTDLDKVGWESELKISPHGLMQGYLNSAPEHLWGIVTNGEKLRLLRDNAQVSRPAYVEFELREILHTEDAKAFRVLWLLLHRSRLKNAKNSILETWNSRASTDGVKARDSLRDSVQNAIGHLGTGFLAHNPSLKAQTQDGTTTPTDLYRWCLKMVYQMVFLFVTEDRDLLFARNPDQPDQYQHNAQTRERAKHYLTKTLRQKATTLRGSPLHTDAYTAWQFLLHHLQQGLPALALPALGSHLFAPNPLSHYKLSNQAFYAAVRALSQIQIEQSRRPVNYASLDSEELGSIYESLLELMPRIELSGKFSLQAVAGNERKTTGSYYTPSSLIDLLLGTALDPVIADAIAKKPPAQAKEALKALKIIDPACGSGHFLIAAARRIGLRLAELEEETLQPSPSALRRAVRTVIAHCIYGTDINPMAIELAKVALWLESQDAGKPLAFLDHRLRVGNSLLGATPDLMTKEDTIPAKLVKKILRPAIFAHTLHLPDDAFVQLEGDDKKTVADLKKRNKQEREFYIERAQGDKELEFAALSASILDAFETLNQIEPDTLENVQKQDQAFSAIQADQELQHRRLIANAWCAAFMLPKLPETPTPTTATLNLLQANPNAQELEPLRQAIAATATQHQFFHPHLEFPDVYAENKGFDCVLGNPPWEQIQLDPAEYFAATLPEIANAANMAAKEKLIAELETKSPFMYEKYLTEKRQMEAVQHFIHTSGRYPTTSFGRLNTAPLFAELGMNWINTNGTLGVIVPTGIATDSFNQYFFNSLIDSKRLLSLYDFENREALFAGVHRSFKFCNLTIGGKNRTTNLANFVFFALNTEDVRDTEKRFQLSPQDIALLNPNTRTTPVFRSTRDANLTKQIYSRIPVLVREEYTSEINGEKVFIPEENPWDVKFMLMFMMNTASSLFRTATELEQQGWTLEGNTYTQNNHTMLPLYEAKLMHQFDHRFATYTQTGDTRDITVEEKANPDFLPLPRYWVDSEEVENRLVQTDKAGNVLWEWTRDWVLGFRDITNTTNERTSIFNPMPRTAVGHTNPIIFSEETALLQSAFFSSINSFVSDYCARQKIGGTHLTFGFLRQFPILPPSVFTPELLAFIAPRVLELTFTAWDLTGFARDLGYLGAPFVWDSERRFWLRAELDALYFLLYGIELSDVDYILETFPIVWRKDEAAFGEYRTKRAILEIYAELRGLGLERILEYRGRVDGVAGGWKV